MALILFYLTGLLCGTMDRTAGSPYQKGVYISVNTGDNLTLECPHNRQVFKYYWFKQGLGEIPRLVSVIYRGAYKGVLEDELKNDTRFKLTVDDSKNNLDISNAQSSDSGTYFCTMSYSMIFQFVQSITVFVNVAQLNVKAAVSQSPHEGIEPGDSVVLKCTVEAEICDGQNRVLWFKQSVESAAGVLYSHGDSRDQCESNTDSPTKSCVYNLPIHNVSSEQTGTYYCAVAACGQVLLGNGTRVSFEAVPVHVYVLSGALVLTSSLLIGVTFCLCMKNSTGTNKEFVNEFI
ncbi:hypothetical protein NQD34_013611 [Periophthalmus magnuspinnatus]|nr:hypothetical protein NQD34_013611 [Periophthalmus magnuspinnatus]